MTVLYIVIINGILVFLLLVILFLLYSLKLSSTWISWFSKLSGFTDFVDPYLTSGLGRVLPHGQLIAYGRFALVYLIEVHSSKSNQTTQLVVKMNMKIDNMAIDEVTYHEAAILAYLRGRAGAPRLVACEPKAGIIIMEYLGPDQMKDIIKYKKICTDSECYELMLSLARQVKELNACGIVHADLKPKNVMVTHNGVKPVAHLIDFGISQKLGNVGPLQFSLKDWER